MPDIQMAVEALRQQINSRHKNKILLLANTIAQLKQTANWDAIYGEFLRQDILSLGYTEMLMAISENPTLISLQYCEYLPNSYKILFQLSFLQHEHLMFAIKNGSIEKTMSLTTARRLRQQFNRF